jgi:F-type H+-transporting ATPase subunit epsilon
MASTIKLDVVSAEKSIFSGHVQAVVATGLMGEIGVEPGHAPLLTLLKPGEVRMTTENGEQEVIYVSGGMLEIQPHVVTVLADDAERAESLDEAAALQAKEKAEQALLNRGAEFNYTLAAAELARAAAQIAAIRKARKQLK